MAVLLVFYPSLGCLFIYVSVLLCVFFSVFSNWISLKFVDMLVVSVTRDTSLEY